MEFTKAIEVSNLTKIYKARSRAGDVLALDNFSISVDNGQIFGLLGPNGAGKTTFIKILLGITNPTVGTGSILGQPFTNYKIRKNVGYLPENHKYPAYLTAEQVLIYFAKLCNYDNQNLPKRIDDLLALVKMSRWKKVKIKKYSKGMMQRLGLALAMINEPQIIFLDEPTDGVDPIGRKEIRDILINLKNDGKTIFVNSHLLSEVELISDRVAILDHGKLVRDGSVDELTTTKEVYDIVIHGEAEDLLFNIENSVVLIKKDGNKFSVKLDSVKILNELIDHLRANHVSIQSIYPKKQSLEELFINTIQEKEEKLS
jgi:ABC-2 type transport system ATP-binding protein